MVHKTQQDRWTCQWCGASGWWTPSTHIGEPPTKDHTRRDGRVCRRTGSHMLQAQKGKAMKRLTAYQRIVRAAKRGTGARLTAAEVTLLAQDEAIRSVADQDDTGPEDLSCFVATKKGLRRRGPGKRGPCYGLEYNGLCIKCLRYIGPLP